VRAGVGLAVQAAGRSDSGSDSRSQLREDLPGQRREDAERDFRREPRRQPGRDWRCEPEREFDGDTGRQFDGEPAEDNRFESKEESVRESRRESGLQSGRDSRCRSRRCLGSTSSDSATERRQAGQEGRAGGVASGRGYLEIPSCQFGLGADSAESALLGFQHRVSHGHIGSSLPSGRGNCEGNGREKRLGC
jgi:hypothetical protein